MQTLKKTTVASSGLKNHAKTKRSHLQEAGQVSHAVNDLLHDGKKLANELYRQGIRKVKNAELNVNGYSYDLLKTIKKNPLASVSIAAGVGFIVSWLMKK